MAPSSISRSYAIYKGSRHYPYPCYVNAASFLSIKLSDKSSYHSWKEQMVCLVESHDMLGFIDGTLKPPKRNDNSKTHANKIIIKRMETKYKEWKRSDTLVKGWIFGSISQDAMVTVIGLDTAKDVWNKLNTAYTTSNTSSDTDSSSTTSSPSSTHSSDISNYHIISNNEDRAAKYITLYKAILAGDWEKAKEIFDMYNDALTAKLDIDGNSPLHIAIGTCKNLQFVSNLLDEINPNSLIHLVNDKNSNALHRAAAVGNIKAAKMLVEKKPHLLFVLDDKENLPINKAVFNFQKNTFIYLFKVSKQYIELSQDEGYESPFEGISAFKLLPDVIIAGFLDAAYEMIKDFPTMAIANNEDNDTPLMSIAGKLDLYYSGSQYNFYQRFVYSYVPTENKDLRSSTNMIKDIENQHTCNTYFFTKCRKSYFYPVIHRIYVKFWEVALLHVPHIKNLHEDKVKHNKALMVLKCICEEVGKISRASDIYEHYGDGFNLAVKNDTPEAVEVILEYCPQAIWTQNNGYTCSQFAIRNRCEKVYNFLVHKVIDNKHLLRTFMDKDENNLLHLAGKLAPLHKLNLVSGAALQMQRELQWFQEVEKFVLPSDKKEENKDDETPIMVFRKQHTKLRKEGEEWMKKTADSYTITAALIITIVFAAAITIPGGNSDTGKAIYAREPSFIIFAISDAISLFTSTTSLLLFLSILTTRYREEDFLYKLPKRLILGLTMLFLSVTSLMVAFSATLYIMFASGEPWILIPIAALTCLPIVSFVTLQLPLLFDLISSTYFHGIFRKEN